MVDMHLATRRRQIAAKGRPVTLRRQTVTRPPAYSDVTVRAFFYAYTPDKVTDALREGDRRVEILNDEIAAAGWPGPPKATDTVLADGQTLSVLGATPLYDGATLLGYRLMVRG